MCIFFRKEEEYNPQMLKLIITWLIGRLHYIFTWPYLTPNLVRILNLISEPFIKPILTPNHNGQTFSRSKRKKIFEWRRRKMASLIPVLPLMFILFTTFYHFGEARYIVVGGSLDAWKVPESSNNTLNHWAESVRFHVEDILGIYLVFFFKFYLYFYLIKWVLGWWRLLPPIYLFQKQKITTNLLSFIFKKLSISYLMLYFFFCLVIILFCHGGGYQIYTSFFYWIHC